MKSKFENYIPYGKEWENEVMKLKKVDIIDALRRKCLENKQLKVILSLYDNNRNIGENDDKKNIFQIPKWIIDEHGNKKANPKYFDELAKTIREG